MRSTLRGASRGALIGVAFGFVVGLLWGAFGAISAATVVLFFVVALGAIGLIIGAWVGAVSYSWRHRRG